LTIRVRELLVGEDMCGITGIVERFIDHMTCMNMVVLDLASVPCMATRHVESCEARQEE
jgi:hypothetical protein